MIIDGDSVIFDSGRKLYANNGIVGLSAKDDVVYEGYDGPLSAGFNADTNELEPGLSQMEIDEICEYMIGLWEKLLDKYGSGKTYVPGTFINT